MREISPAENMSADEFFELAPPEIQEVVARIRWEKKNKTRPCPSAILIDQSKLLTKEFRKKLLDEIAELVDQNLCGRSEMCMQFADLLHRALKHLQLPARAVIGKAIYFSAGQEVFRWEHAWVCVDSEVIDGNVDSLFENPKVPSVVDIAPYWGPIAKTPADRRLRQNARTLSF